MAQSIFPTNLFYLLKYYYLLDLYPKLRQPLASRLARLLVLTQEVFDPFRHILLACSAHTPAAAAFGVQLQELVIIVGKMEYQEFKDGALFRLAPHLLLLGQALPATGDGPHDLRACLFWVFGQGDVALRLGG